MSLALYMDENVHRAITLGLRLRGVDVLTAQEDGRGGLPDGSLLDRAAELGRVLFTQDDDLLAEANLRQSNGTFFAGIVYAHQMHITIGDCIRDLELLAKLATAEELANRVEFLPL